jgi:hypothetical protein
MFSRDMNEPGGDVSGATVDMRKEHTRFQIKARIGVDAYTGVTGPGLSST